MRLDQPDKIEEKWNEVLKIKLYFVVSGLVSFFIALVGIIYVGMLAFVWTKWSLFLALESGHIYLNDLISSLFDSSGLTITKMVMVEPSNEYWTNISESPEESVFNFPLVSANFWWDGLVDLDGLIPISENKRF